MSTTREEYLALMRPRKRRCALVLGSTTDGPWVRVARGRLIEVLGATENDVVEIHRRGTSNRDPITIRGSMRVNIFHDHGDLKVVRRSGSSPINVYVVSEKC